MARQRALSQNAITGNALDRRASVTTTTSQTHVSQYSGPIPPPELLQSYEEILPGSADRILAVFENQTAHRINMESTVIRGDNSRSWAGLACGLIVSLAAMAVSAFAIHNGAALAGTLLAGGSLSSLVGVFVYGTKIRKEERQGRQRR
jgi:uncharacterized membrane protein